MSQTEQTNTQPGFMSTLKNLFADDNRVPSHEVKGTTPAKSLLATILTEAEVNRRMCEAIDQAVSTRDMAYLQDLAMVTETLGAVSPQSVILESPDINHLARVRQWVQKWFADCSAEPILYMVCKGSPTAMEISDVQKRTMQACSIPMNRIAPPVYLPNVNGHRTETVIHAQIKYESRAFSQIITAMREHLRSKALEHCESHSNSDEKVPVRRQVNVYLSWLLTQTPTSNDPQAATPIATATKTPDFGFPVTAGLPAHIAQALSSRLALYERKAAHQSADGNPSTNAWMQQEFRQAMEGCDPLDVAAMACLLWNTGSKIEHLEPQHPPKGKDRIKVQAKGDEGEKSAASVARDMERKTGEILLTTDELAALVKYDVRTIRDRLVGTVLLKDVHYIQPFNGRKILFRWDKVAALMGLDAEVKNVG